MTTLTIIQQQCLLKYLDYYTGEVDGMNGPKTQQAISTFTREYGVGVEGLIGAISGTISKKRTDESFWDGIENFSKNEFRCTCNECGGFPVEINNELVKKLQTLRTAVKKPIIISSAIRCKKHNIEVGGVYNSKHLTGNAVDFCIKGMTSTSTTTLLKQHMGKINYTYKIDSNFVHVDI